MSEANGFLDRYLARGWICVPVHRPDRTTGDCSCGKPQCATPGKHPVAAHWPGGSTDPEHFANRNLGVQLGPDSAHLADIDLDCDCAVAAAQFLLPPTDCSFGRCGLATHALYVLTDETASFTKLIDPVLSGSRSTIIELRWPEKDTEKNRYKSIQTVFPPSLHKSGETVEWLRDGDPTRIGGADLAAAVRHIGAAVLIARYARPKERHALVLLVANLLVRAGWEDDARVIGFLTAVFTARKDPDKVSKIQDGEGRGAVTDARKRLAGRKPMSGLPALREMLDPVLDSPTAEKIIARIKEWLDVPDPLNSKSAAATGPDSGKPRRRYKPLPPWRPFPTELLPGAIREFVHTVSQAMRCDPTFVALPALAACAGMIGSTRQIRLKKSWVEPAVIWAVVVGDSGTLKTPPYKRAVAPVVALQAAHLKAYSAAIQLFRADLREYEPRKRRVEGPGDPPLEPQCTRIYSRDTTVEALAGILMNNRTRFLIGRDELSGWLASFNQYKSKGGSDLANWLELHSLGTLCVDRKTGDPKTIFVHGVGVSLCGGIQPDVLRAALSPQHFSAGVPARLLFAYPPRRPKEWTEDDIDEAVDARYHRLIKELATLEPHTEDDGTPYPVTLGMTPDAKAEWIRFYQRFAKRQAETEGELAAAFSKLEGYAARLALIHHVCQQVDAGSDDLMAVTLASIRAGIALAEWFSYEAERVYQMLAEQAEEHETRRLVESVNHLAERQGGRLTVKDLQRSNQRKYRSAEMAAAALDSLVTIGMGHWEDTQPGPHGGRPSRFFVPCVTYDETDETSPPESSMDPAIGDSNGDDTRRRVTKPLADESSQMAVTPFQETSRERTSPEAPEVSSVSSYVTHAPGDQQQPLPGPSNTEGGFVTREAEVSSHTYPVGISLVTDSAGVATVAEAILGWVGPIALDTETTGFDPTTDRVRLIQIAMGDEVALIDVFALADPVSTLAPLFAALAGKEIVGHNLQFDLRMLAPLGFTPGRVFDTMLASRILYAGDRGENNGRVSHGLEDAAKRELGRVLDKTQQASDWSRTLAPAQLAYGAADAQVLLPLAEALRTKLGAAGLTGIADLEMRALPGVAWCGPVTVDAIAWLAQAESAGTEQSRLQEQMDTLAPNPACLPGTESRNWNSTDDVRSAFLQLGIILESTDDSALAAIDHPLAALVRDYRGVTKRVGTYGRSWLEKHVGTDGRVLPSWNQLGTDSGRMSCSDPNLQQIPRGSDYRSCITAGPGKLLVKADYSQVELRIAAKVANEEVMIAAYRAGGDLHRLTAARVLGKPEVDVTKADRQIAKSLNFGLLYGMGWRGLRSYALANYGVSLSDDKARSYRDAFFRAYPGLRAWHQRVGRELDERFRTDPSGTFEVWTLGGRRRVLPVARKSRDGTSYPSFNDALNAPVQGTGADGLKGAIARLWETRAECPGAIPVLYCHDEIVLEVEAANANRAGEWLRRCMVEAVAPLIDPVPVEVEVTTGRTWGG